MKLFLVKEGQRQVWVAALANENMYSYVGNTGRFHDNNALRNDFYMEQHFEYEELTIAEAEELISAGVGTIDESERADALSKWRSDTASLAPHDVFQMAAGSNP